MGPVTIAVTGPFASGKSTLVRLLGKLGAETVSADAIVHDLLAQDSETVERVARHFGDGVRGGSGIDRKALGAVVFGDERALADLEGILHPLVRRETMERAERSGAELFVAEVPLLFEGESAYAFDHTVAVVTPEGRRRAWSEERGVDEMRRRTIERRQIPQEEKAERADFVIQNDGDLRRLEESARALRAEVLRERAAGPEERSDVGDEDEER
jgi:dephospho-CoA kinase